MGHSFSRTRLLVRSFFIQGSWNYRNLLGTGFAWALRPETGSVSGPEGGPTGRRDTEAEEVARAAEPFNTHPYLSPVALGALARMREDGVDPTRIQAFRQALRSPLGGLGDGLFWGGWRPACLLGAGCVALLGGEPGVVLATFLVTYNAVHLALRVRGIRVGSESGLEVAAGVRGMSLPAWTERIRAVGVLLLGLALGLLLGRGAAVPELGPAWVAGALVLFLAGLSGGDLVRRWGPELLFLLILAGTRIPPS
jgi:PTS system mannose-specific IID component